MKYSFYNVITDNSPHNYLLYNVLTEGIIELDEDDLSYYNHCLEEGMDLDERFAILSEMQFLIPDDYDERAFIRFSNRKNSYSNKNLQIVIAPTMDCNFSCIYCFEKHHKGAMTEELQDKTVEFVTRELKAKGYSRLHVDWFGGEPLMAWDTVKSLSRRLMDYCSENGIEYAASIISNGYLLTEEIARDMSELKIEDIQLTLDGEKAVHDSRRMLKGGGGTYDVTLEKIALLKDFDILVSVRVNTDRRNRESYIRLGEIIKELNPSAHVYPARMECFPETDKCNCSAEMSLEEFAREIKIPHILTEDFVPEMPNKFFSCQAERANSFAVDEQGYLYKCWNQIGDLTAAYGNIKTYPEETNIVNLLTYMGTDILEDEECSRCKVLPLCMGGCAYQRNFKGVKQCTVEKYCLDEIIKAIWKSNQTADEA